MLTCTVKICTIKSTTMIIIHALLVECHCNSTNPEATLEIDSLGGIIHRKVLTSL